MASTYASGCQTTQLPRLLQVAFRASDMHGVEAVEGWGERFTLALWFTCDRAHDEDPKLLARLAGGGMGVGRARQAAPSA